ncbi:MAG TPA: 16S rRNA (cytidine(1402)-2'-O)-methyltransferase [Candidatus Acidoferrum sp.]|nr:16S rRNA (cytidine(1402)-2'-O)-methyltransferase [Candidatus Acidoferrum sp.]
MQIEKGTLYLVGTPIGNLGDLAPRAAEVLAGVDLVAAEDTRVTAKLMGHLGLSKPMLSYYEHNIRERGELLLARLSAGESVALCTDAGMPAVSDPGADLVRLCHEAGVPVVCVPGPSALTAALALSGRAVGRFCFEGFLTTNRKGRKEHLAQLSREQRTLVFYEAPHKLTRTLADMLEVWGDRGLTVCREMTKLHEEAIYTTLSQALARYEETPPRGEFVLVIEGAGETGDDEAPDIRGALTAALSAGLSGRDAVRQAAAVTGAAKNEVYACYQKEFLGYDQ